MKADCIRFLILVALVGMISNLLVVKPILFNGALNSQKVKEAKSNRNLKDELSIGEVDRENESSTSHEDGKIQIDAGHGSTHSDEDSPTQGQITKA